ncbi:MalY/PatB family protein [Hoylesella oralis]|uniref:MalY/PatB family protein n=1 Tax=Hoylesella oralis TaxID=28134 RepID=UPI0028E93B79|nr:MalY/PatB family protein [Hoylesella oralis]
MNYDFDKIITRRGTNSYKWDELKGSDIIPMWVADMDFQTAPCIIEALQRRVEHGIFGYTLVPSSYYDAVIGWFNRRHQWQIDRSWILYTSGVVPALSAIIKALTQPKDKVLIQSPVYNCFFSSIKNNGCEAVESPLVYQKNTYYVDWNDFEAKLSDPLVKLFILCNPHNPAGRVWKREELLRMNELCMKHGVKVIADEIHCELVMPGHTFVPFASISEDTLNNSITCNSPSKSFNTAGLQIANIICNDKETRLRIDRAININEVCDVNPFGVIALQVAYNEGSDWLDALNAYLYDNYLALKTYFAANMPQLEVTRLEGTYLVWVNIKPLGISSDALTEKLLSEAKVKVNSGTMYGRQTGEGFIRLNIACPRSQMMEGLQRIKQVVTK